MWNKIYQQYLPCVCLQVADWGGSMLTQETIAYMPKGGNYEIHDI